MVNTKIEEETKEDKFKRIAGARTRRILEYIRLLGNCSNTSNYSYSEEEVKKTFNTIEKELNYVKSLFNKPKTEFSLD